MTNAYGASLDRTALVVTITVIALTSTSIVALVVAARNRGPFTRVILLSSAAIVFLALVGTFLLRPRSYTVSDNGVSVERTMSPVRLSAGNLVRVEQIPPKSLGSTVRTFGSGGLFGYFGYFDSSGRGKLKMYATRRDTLVGLYSSDGLIVISPNDPVAFVEDAKRLTKR
jgi:hypothetical protein